MSIRGFLAAAMLALTACGGHAAVVTATPETAQSLLANASAGDTIKLAPGKYAALFLSNKDWTPSVVVEAAPATITSVTLNGVLGLTWRGGTFDGGDTEKWGIHLQKGGRLVVEGTTMRHYLRVGIGLGEVADGRLTGNTFSDMGADGIDIAMSRRLVIDKTDCHDFYPTKGAHPDCIQLWSRPDWPPTADITITNSHIVGVMQGISLFNHVRDGVDDGGFDRISISNNFVRVAQYNGITLWACRECTARDNRVETLPSDNPRIRAWIKGAPDVTLCNNVVVAFPGTADGRCKR